jgi:hypothetical protein
MRWPLLLVLVACTNEVDPAWQLDHDRVIAVSMTPPHIAAGETSQVNGLVGRKGDAPFEVDPVTVTVESPTSLMSTLSQTTDGHWQVTTASDAQLAAARTELELAATDPVPVSLRMEFAYQDLIAHKLVYMGDHADNPSLGVIMIDGVDATTETSLTVAPATDIPLQVDFPQLDDINWLSSCGSMHDFDLAKAYLRVEPEDPQTGTLGVVVRDTQGGVAWQFWPISAQ